MCVNIWYFLDWIVGLALPWHIVCATSECTKRDAIMAGEDKLWENTNPLQGTTWFNEELCSGGRFENGC